MKFDYSGKTQKYILTVASGNDKGLYGPMNLKELKTELDAIISNYIGEEEVPLVKDFIIWQPTSLGAGANVREYVSKKYRDIIQ